MYRTSFRNLFLISLVIGPIAIVLKLAHNPLGQWLLLASFILTISYVVIGIIEINRSTKISDSTKVIWTICMIACSFVTAIFYLINRKSIV